MPKVSGMPVQSNVRASEVAMDDDEEYSIAPPEAATTSEPGESADSAVVAEGNDGKPDERSS